MNAAPEVLPEGFDDAALPPPFVRSPARFVLHYVADRRWNFVGLAVLVLGASACSVGVQYMIKLLVDAVTHQQAASGRLAWVVALFMVLVAGESLFGRMTGWLACRTTVDIGVDLRLDLFHFLSGQSMRYFADNLAGALGQRITGTAGNFGALVNTIVWRILPPIIDFAGAILIFTTINALTAGTLAGFVVLVTAGLIWFGERGRPIHRSYSGEAATNSGDLTDSLANMWTVKAFSARRREWMRLSTRFHHEASAQRRSWMYVEKARLIHDVALWLMAGTMLVWVLSLWNSGRASPGDVVIVFTLTFRILHSSKDLALSLVDIAQNVGFIEETLAVVGQPRAVFDAPRAPRLVCSGSTIAFENVSFAYVPGRSTLRNINLTISSGQRVGIVGPSGAGKSTLIHLLQRLHDVGSGRILIDGQDIAKVSQDSLRAALAVVPQEITLLHRSVMENIRFARPLASDAEVFAAARAAACDGFIRRLPAGYDTAIGERGAKLSGGQRQRVGIARAFLKDAPVIIFDEATSALDTESEIAIQNSLARLTGRTVIAVAHRLSTLAAFDRVIVVDDGQVVQDGTVADLLSRPGLFEQMWRLQTQGLTKADGRAVA
jgi:ATP-binding cassette subfamily B protein